MRLNYTFFAVNVLPYIIFLCFIMGWIFPDYFWGVHSLAFIPISLQVSTFLMVSGLLVTSQIIKNKQIFDYKISHIFVIISSLLFGLLCYNFPIEGDYYGNARNFQPFLNQTTTTLENGFLTDLFKLEFKTGQGRWGVFNSVKLLSYAFEINHLKSFHILNALSGILFMSCWLVFLKRLKLSKYWQTIFIIIGFTTPMLLVFFGHIESYGLIIPIFLIWNILVYKTLKNKSVKQYLWLLPLVLVCLRFHTLSIVLVVQWFIVLLCLIRTDSKLNCVLKSPKSSLLYLVLPFLIIGIITYVFVFQGIYNERTLNSDIQDIDRIFLPLFSPEPPLDTYNLLSWNHFFDLLNVLFYWSPAIIFVLFLIFSYRKQIRWTSTYSILLLPTIYISLILFGINPLFSLPMDWDLYTLPLPFLLVFLAVLSKHITLKQDATKLTIKVFALSLLSIPTFIVFTNLNWHSQRLESVAKHVFKTYYLHSDSYMLYSLKLDPKNYEQRLDHLILDLQSSLTKFNTPKYASLLIDKGLIERKNGHIDEAYSTFKTAETYNPDWPYFKIYKDSVDNEFQIENGLQLLRKQNNPKEAITQFKNAIKANPEKKIVHIYMMEAYFKLEDYNNALLKAQLLLKNNYPDNKTAMLFVIHSSIMADKYQITKKASAEFLKLEPNHPQVRVIFENIDDASKIDGLKQLFLN